MTGKTRMMNVSRPGGLSDKRPNSHKNGQSGRGLAPASVGSGGSDGPFGPTTAARATTTITTSAEKNASFSIAGPRNGSPFFEFLFVLLVIGLRIDRVVPAPAVR